jgi:hypothetical protein
MTEHATNNNNTNNNKKMFKRSFWHELTSLSGDKIAHLIISLLFAAPEFYLYYCFATAFVSLPGMFDIYNYFIEVPIVIGFLGVAQTLILVTQLVQYRNAYNDGRLKGTEDIHPYQWAGAIFKHGAIGEAYTHILSASVVPLLWYILMSYNWTKVDMNEVNKNYPYIQFLLWCFLRLTQINFVRGLIMGTQIAYKEIMDEDDDDG